MHTDNSSSVSFEMPLASVDQARSALETLKAAVTIGLMVVEQDTGDAVKLVQFA